MSERDSIGSSRLSIPFLDGRHLLMHVLPFSTPQVIPRDPVSPWADFERPVTTGFAVREQSGLQGGEGAGGEKQGSREHLERRAGWTRYEGAHLREHPTGPQPICVGLIGRALSSSLLMCMKVTVTHVAMIGQVCHVSQGCSALMPPPLHMCAGHTCERCFQAPLCRWPGGPPSCRPILGPA